MNVVRDSEALKWSLEHVGSPIPPPMPLIAAKTCTSQSEDRLDRAFTQCEREISLGHLEVSLPLSKFILECSDLTRASRRCLREAKVDPTAHCMTWEEKTEVEK